jgi:predicted nucleic acid-binding protein
MFLLDTNVVSELNRPAPAKEVSAWVRSVPQNDLFMSVITVAEIVKGITRHPDPVRRQSLQNWLDTSVRPWLHGRILPVSEIIAEKTGQISGEHDASGKPITLADAAIAATAIEYGFTLVTRNVKDFTRVRLDLINPWTPIDAALQ